MVNRPRARGTAFETAVVRWLNENGYAAERRALAGSLDKGDIAGVPDWTCELKNVKKPAYPQWIREAEAERINAGTRYGVVLAKPHLVGLGSPDGWVAAMPAPQWLRIVKQLNW